MMMNKERSETSEKPHINVILRSGATNHAESVIAFLFEIKNEILRFAQNDNRQTVFQRSRSNFFILFVLHCSLLLVLSGCAASRNAAIVNPFGTDNFTPEEIIERVNSHALECSTLQASGTLAVESPNFSNSASFEVRIHRPDSVLIQVQGPFGIHVGALLLIKDRYTFYNAIRNEVAEGDISKDGIPMLRTEGINPQLIIDALCGARSFAAYHIQPDSLSSNSENYFLRFRRNNIITEYVVNKKLLTLTGVSEIDSAGTAIQEEEYSYTQRENGSILPQSIRATTPPRNTSLAFVYNTVSINTPLPPFVLDIPSDAERIELRHK